MNRKCVLLTVIVQSEWEEEGKGEEELERRKEEGQLHDFGRLLFKFSKLGRK